MKQISIIGLFVIVLACLSWPGYLFAQNDALREAMDDTQGAKDELMEAVNTEQGEKITAAADTIVKLLEEVRTFWADKKMPDVLKMFDDTIGQAKAMSAMGTSGKLDGAKEAFAKLNASCSRCHDTHPEEKLPK